MTEVKLRGRKKGFRWNPPAKLAEKYYTRREAMVALGVSERKLSGLLRAGLIHRITYDGCHTLILKTSVSLYIAERTGDGLPPPATKKAKRC